MGPQNCSPETSPDLAMGLLFDEHDVAEKPTKSKKDRKSSSKNRNMKKSKVTVVSCSDETAESSPSSPSSPDMTSSSGGGSSKAVTTSPESPSKVMNTTTDSENGTKDSISDTNSGEAVGSGSHQISSGNKNTTSRGESSSRIDTSSEDTCGPVESLSDTPGWSASLDALLVAMKEGDETWADISRALCKSKKEVKARYKELAASDSSQSPTRDAASQERIAKKTKSAEKKARMDKAKAREKESKRGKPKRDGQKETARETAQTLFAVRQKQTGNIAGGGTLDLDSRSKRSLVTVPPARNPNRPVDDDSDSDIAQRDYLQKIREEIYPAYLSFEPDPYLTEQDCRVLATVHSKMQRSRWLEMQANFCNATGVMIPIEFLKQKTEEAEAKALAEERNARARSWVDNLSDGHYDSSEPWDAVDESDS
jgi:hypothetical protein